MRISDWSSAVCSSDLPGRQVGEEGDGVEDREAFGRELAHGVVPAGKRALSPAAVGGADKVPIAAAAGKSWVVERPLLIPDLSTKWPSVARRRRQGQRRSRRERQTRRGERGGGSAIRSLRLRPVATPQSDRAAQAR